MSETLEALKGLLAPKKMSAKTFPPPKGGDQPVDTEQLAQDIAAATQPAPLPSYEKKETEKKKTKTENVMKTRAQKAFSDRTHNTLSERWLSEPTTQAQIQGLKQLREDIDKFVQTPAELDLSPLMQWGDFMTGGHYDLAANYKPGMTTADKKKLANDMEKLYQNSVYDLQKAKNQFIQAQTKGFEEVQNKRTNELMSQTSQIWRDASSAMKGKKLTSQQFDKLSGFDEVYGMLRYLEQGYYNTYAGDGIPSISDVSNYNQMKTYAAQKIGKALEGKMTDEDFKRISGLLPGTWEFVGIGDAQTKFSQIYDLLEIGRQKFGDNIEKYKGLKLKVGPGEMLYTGPAKDDDSPPPRSGGGRRSSPPPKKSGSGASRAGAKSLFNPGGPKP